MVIKEHEIARTLAGIGRIIKAKVIPDLESVYLFGSALDESKFDIHSDIDMALFAPSLSKHERDRIYRLRKCLIDAGYTKELVAKIDFLLIATNKKLTRSGFVRREVIERGVELSV